MLGTRRQEIVDGIIQRLKKITIDNGACVDVKAVYDWIGRPARDGEFPLVVIYDNETDVSGNDHVQINEMDFKIVGAIKNHGHQTTKILRGFTDDILKAVYLNAKDLIELEYRELKSIDFEIGDEGGYFGEVVLKFKIKYETERGSI